MKQQQPTNQREPARYAVPSNIETMRIQRKLAELTYEQLSRETGITVYQLKRAEREPEKAQVIILQTIARYFNIRTSTMFPID